MLGQKNLPPLPADFGESVVDPNIPPPSTGKTESKAKDMASQLPVVPKSPSNHFAIFLRACKGEEKCRSSFDIADPLSQVLVLGVTAQRLNRNRF